MHPQCSLCPAGTQNTGTDQSAIRNNDHGRPQRLARESSMYTHLPAGFAVPPSSHLGMERLAEAPLLERAAAHRKTENTHACMHQALAGSKSHASQTTHPERNRQLYTKPPGIRRNRKRRSDHST
jgi:hypothetical protein